MASSIAKHTPGLVRELILQSCRPLRCLLIACQGSGSAVLLGPTCLYAREEAGPLAASTYGYGDGDRVAINVTSHVSTTSMSGRLYIVQPGDVKCWPRSRLRRRLAAACYPAELTLGCRPQKIQQPIESL